MHQPCPPGTGLAPRKGSLHARWRRNSPPECTTSVRKRLADAASTLAPLALPQRPTVRSQPDDTTGFRTPHSGYRTPDATRASGCRQPCAPVQDHHHDLPPLHASAMGAALSPCTARQRSPALRRHRWRPDDFARLRRELADARPVAARLPCRCRRGARPAAAHTTAASRWIRSVCCRRRNSTAVSSPRSPSNARRPKTCSCSTPSCGSNWRRG